MKIAVLMSTYNGEKYIIEQIESILNQKSEAQIDLWVRDDGSKDGTVQILESYAEEGKLKWYSGDNLKPAKSFMDLLLHCGGYDFYSFADQDDYWYPDKIQQGLEQIKNIDKPALYFANAKLVDENRSPLGRDVYRNGIHSDLYSITIAGGILGCTVMFNSMLAQSVIERGMPPKISMHDKYIASICNILKGKIIYDSTAVMDYRQHSGNVIGASTSKLGAIKNRFKLITTPAEVSVTEQAECILDIYTDVLNEKDRLWLEKIADYKKSFKNTVALAFSRKPKFNSRNIGMTLRLSILLRKK